MGGGEMAMEMGGRTHFEWHQKLNALRLNKFIYISHTGATPAFCVAAPNAQTLGNWDPVKLETEY